MLAAYEAGESHQALGDELRVLDNIGGVADHTGNEDLALRKLDLAPDLPLVLMARVTGLDRCCPVRRPA